MPTPPNRRDEGRPDSTNEALIAFFRTKLGKEADGKLIAFLEKSGNQELPAGLVKPALSLLGISGDLGSLSNAQVQDCVERNSRSLLKDLQDFKAGAKQVVADRAKTVVARLAISLQSVARIREGLKSPKTLPPETKPTASPPAPCPTAPAVSISTGAASSPKRQSSSLGLGIVAMVVCGLLAVVVIGAGVAWTVLGRQTAAVPAKTQITPPSAPTKESKTVPALQEKAPPAVDSAKATPATAATPKPSKTAAVAPPDIARQPPEPSAGVAKEVGPSEPVVPAPDENPRALSDLAQGKPAEIKKVEIDKQEFDRMRASLRDAVKDTADGEKVDAILAFAADPEIVKSPAATKAVLAEALVQSLTTKDLRRAQETLSRIRDSSELFAEEEYRASVTRVKDLAATSGNRAAAFALIDQLRQREALLPQDALAEKAALLRTAAGDKALKKPASLELRQELAGEMVALAIEGADLRPEIAEGLLAEARKTAGTISNRERRAAFEKEMSAAKAVVAEGKRFQQAEEQLAKDPGDAAARKVRVDILVSRGKAKDVLADLASIDHPLQGLAKDTDVLLKKGAQAGGKECFSCSQKWVKAATESEGAKKVGLQQLAHELTALAISAKNDPLDPFALQKAKQQEASLAESTFAGSPKPAEGSSGSGSSDKLTGVVNLLSSERVKVNVLRGKAEKSKTAYLADHGLLEFAADLTGGTYRLRSTFVRTSGNDTVGYTFPVGKSGVTLALGALNDAITGLCDIDGKGADVNGSGIRLGLQNNRLYSVQIDVLQIAADAFQVVAVLDGEKIVDWKGSPDALSHQPDYAATSRSMFAVGAINCNMELRSLELHLPATAKVSTKERRAGRTEARNPFAGNWKVTYENGNVRKYQIDEMGNVFFVETNQSTLLSRKGNDFLLDFKDGKLDRIRLVEGILVVEHFDPASRYPDSPTLKGTGARE